MAALVAAGALPAGATVARAAEAPTVEASGTRFSPADVEVEPGTEVTWKVMDDRTHTVTFEDDPDDSLWTKGTGPRRRFDQAGVFNYVCKVHEAQGMKGVVRVVDPDAPPPTEPPPTQPPTTQPPTTRPPTTQPPATQPPATQPPATQPPTTRPKATTTTKPTRSKAASQDKKPEKSKATTTTEKETTTTTAPPPTTSTVPLPPLGAQGPLVKAPAATTTTTIGLAEPEPGEDGFVAIDDTPGNGGTGTLTMLVLGGLGASLAVAGVVWWRRRPGRYWSA